MCLRELLLGVTPHSGVCVPERAVVRSSSTLRCVCAWELLHTRLIEYIYSMFVCSSYDIPVCMFTVCVYI